MNRKQQLILIAAAAAIILSTLVVPWDLSGADSHTNKTTYRPLFFPPELGVWSERRLSSSVPWTWAAITVCGTFLFFAVRDQQAKQ
jgi:hypothetical protein